jgi:putative endonuclease
MKTSNQKLGNKGEALAVAHLQKNGYVILDRNFRSGRCELDIIARKDSVLTVCEVKSFFADPLGAAEFRVHKAKQKQVIQGTYGYLGEHPEYEGMDIRFDVIIVDLSTYPAQITHHEAAFWQEEY